MLRSLRPICTRFECSKPSTSSGFSAQGLSSVVYLCRESTFCYVDGSIFRIGSVVGSEQTRFISTLPSALDSSEIEDSCTVSAKSPFKVSCSTDLAES